LHPVLKAAWTIALWAVIEKRPDQAFRIVTPRSERREELDHSYAMGNYVSTPSFTTSPTSEDGFWAMTRSIAKHLSDPEVIQQGRYGIGSLANLDDPPDYKSLNGDKRIPTAWEGLYFSMAEGRPAPYGSSLTLSNLGLVRLPKDVKSVCWAQPAVNPMAAAVLVSALGHEGGLEFGITWREGCAIVGEDVERMERVLCRMLRRLSEGEGEVEGEVRCGDLVS
jgi:hypothetical protein